MFQSWVDGEEEKISTLVIVFHYQRFCYWISTLHSYITFIQIHFPAWRPSTDQTNSKLPWWRRLARSARKVAFGLHGESMIIYFFGKKNLIESWPTILISFAGSHSFSQFLPYTCVCTQYALRYKALDGDMTRYSCFQVAIIWTIFAKHDFFSVISTNNFFRGTSTAVALKLERWVRRTAQSCACSLRLAAAMAWLSLRQEQWF